MSNRRVFLDPFSGTCCNADNMVHVKGDKNITAQVEPGHWETCFVMTCSVCGRKWFRSVINDTRLFQFRNK